MSTTIAKLPDVAVAPLCTALDVPRSWARPRVHGCRPRALSSVRALPSEVRAEVLATLHSPRFIDCAPAEVFYTLLSEDQYLCSERSMYRILHDNDEVKERRAQRQHPTYQRPELMATAPNQVWSWDITRLRTHEKWKYVYLYVVIDIFSRAVVGWLVAKRETAALGVRLIEEAVAGQGVRPATLVVHADRGAQMTSKTMAQLLADLDVGRSFSRPQVSNDNPFSESQFKTLKYHPTFPSKFVGTNDAVVFCRSYFTWYNEQHRHSGIAYLTPAVMHAGNGERELQRRHEVMLRAHAAHPHRFARKPKRATLPTAVYINPPDAPPRSEAAQMSPLPQPPSSSSSPLQPERSEGRAMTTMMGAHSRPPDSEFEPSSTAAVLH